MKKIVGILITIIMVMSLCFAMAACQSDCAQGKHAWDEGEITKAATCTAKGEKTYKCQNCDETKVEEVAMLAHTIVANDAVNKDATCTEEGVTGATKCSVCGTAISAGTAIPAKNHVDEDEDGICDVCEEAMPVVDPEDPCKDGHTWDEGTVTTPATCTTKGEKTYTCEVCEETRTEEIGMIDHDPVADDEVNKAATCTEAGVEGATKCSVCGNAINAGTPIPAAGHNMDEETGLCSVCGKAEVTISETELALSIDNATATLTATASNNGEITWTSSSAATVAVADGVLTAKKPGTATITAKLATGESATCVVTVANAYYLIGGPDSAWGTVASFGLANKIYFYGTETEGIYKTNSIELGKKAEFQIALVGVTGSNWWQSAYNHSCNSKDAANVLKATGDSNFQVAKHGKYTITLDLTGAKAVVSGVLDEDLSSGDTIDMYYLIGAMNNWSTAATEAAAGDYLFSYDEETDTYSLTMKLTKGQEFKVAIVGLAWSGALGESALPRTQIGNKGTATAAKSYQLEWTSTDNIGVGVTGWYTFTLDPNGGANNILTYTFSETDPSLEVPEVDAE